MYYELGHLENLPLNTQLLVGPLFQVGKKKGFNQMLLARDTETCYTELCKLDVLRIKDKNESRNDEVYQEFKEQLGRDETGCYETNLNVFARNTFVIKRRTKRERRF